jgi:hypothetical protein
LKQNDIGDHNTQSAFEILINKSSDSVHLIEQEASLGLEKLVDAI